MAISFNEISATSRVNAFSAEFDNSRASQGPALLAYTGLLIGQKTSAGTGTANTIMGPYTNANQVQTVGGRGSELHRMAIAWFKSNKSTALYIGVLDDNGSGVAATKTLTFGSTATEAGTINCYVGGEKVSIAVASGDAHTAVSLALKNKIATDHLDLPVIATDSGTGVVTLTARNKGVAGQNLDVRLNYQAGEALPAGLTCVVANAVAGVTNPVLTTLIAAMGDTWYQIIAHPYADATSLTALEAELLSRFGPERMIDGLAITASAGSSATLIALGATRNSKHSVIFAQPGASPVTPPAEFAAEAAALIAKYGAIDPARPFQTLQFTHAKGPAEADLFSKAERDLGLWDGVAATKMGAGGVVQIDRAITTYQTNAGGAADPSYLDVNTLLTLMYLRYSWCNRMLSRYPRHKLAGDTFTPAAGQAVITPRIGKAEACAWFKSMEELGLVENYEQFKTDLVCERDASDANRLNFLLSPDVINQCVRGATKFLWLL